MRIRNIVIVAVVIVLAVAVTVGILASNVDKYRPRVQAELQKKLDRQVTIGHLGLHFFPLSIGADGVTVAEAPTFNSPRPFATAKALYVSVGLFSLIGGNPEVKELILDRPQIELIHNAAGVWNFSTIGGPSTPGPSGGGSSVSLNELKINDGQVAITDQAANQPRSVYDHIDLKLTDFAPGKKFGLDIAAHLPGQGKQLLSFKGKVGPLNSANSAATPVDGHISLEEVSLAAANRFAAGTLPPQTDCIASGDADVSSQATQLSAKGNLKLQNVMLKGSKLDYPISADYDLTADRVQNTIQVRSGKIQLGSTSLNISGSLDGHAKPSNVNVQLSTKNSSVSELAKLAGASGTGQLSANVHVQGPIEKPSDLNISGDANLANVSLTTPDLTKPLTVRSANIQFSQNSAAITGLVAALGKTNLQGNISAKNFAAPDVQFNLSSDNVDGDELETITPKQAAAKAPAPGKAPAANQPSLLTKMTGSGSLTAKVIKAQGFVLNNLHATVKLNNGVITLSPLTTGIFGGTENGTLTLDVRPADPLCAVNAKFAGVDTNALLSAVSTAKNTLYGSLAADTNLRFALVSSNDLPRTLNGNLSFDVTNGQLKNVNILNELSKVGKFLGSAPGQGGNSTALKKLAGTLNIVNGVASTNNLNAALDAGSLAATGTINLVNQGLDMHMTAALASGPSQAVGGNHVGGILNTALSNNKGELVIPVLVSGTMSSPKFAPDAQALAKMKLNNVLPSASGLLGGKAGGAGGIVNGLLGGGQAQPGAAQKQSPQDTVNSLLNQFGKKKKKQ